MSTASPAPASSSRATLVKWLAIAVVVAALLVASRRIGAEVPRFAEWVAGLGALGPVVFIAGYVVSVVALVPASLLTLVAGAIFGLAAGVAYVFVAATIGAALAFLVSRYLARGLVERRIAGNASFAAIDRAVAAQGRKIVFLLRLSPAFPFSLMNYALGVTRVRFTDYVVASIGMLPGTFLFVYYGKLAGDVAALAGGAPVEKGNGYYGVLVVGLVATIAVTAVVTRIARRALADATEKKTLQESMLSARTALERAHTMGEGAPIPPAFRRMPEQAANPGIAPPAQASPPDPRETARIEERRAATAKSRESAADYQTVVAPLDEHNTRLLVRVRPTDWINPEPKSRYDLVVVGAGTGGLISAAVGAGLGARVALVERNLMGGDCLNYGCVPSKAVIRHARSVKEARELFGAARFDDAELDRQFAAAMERMRRLRAEIARDDSARRYRDELGIDVFQGNARFTGQGALEVAGTTLRFKKAIIASGAGAAVPDIPGLAETGFMTNETVFNLVERPRRVAILGGGPIGCEMAQALQRLGCQVTVLDIEDRLLPREDEDAAAIVQSRLEREGVRLVLGVEVTSVVRAGDGSSTLRYRNVGGGSEAAVSCDRILVAVGRRPNVDDMGLEAAGVAASERGIVVNDHLRTSNRRIFAVGDCCMKWKFTHAADAAAKIAVQNALFFGRKKLDALVMPWCTYTDPEVAHVGLYEHEAKRKGIDTDTFTVPLEKVNRAVLDGEAEGFVRVLVRKGSDAVLGATIVSSHAGESISELSLAITGALGLGKIAATIHPYPTQAEGIKAAANAYMRTKLTPAAKRVLGILLRIQR